MDSTLYIPTAAACRPSQPPRIPAGETQPLAPACICVSDQSSFQTFCNTPRLMQPLNDPKFPFPPLSFSISHLASYLTTWVNVNPCGYLSEVRAVNGSATEALGGLSSINHELMVNCSCPTSPYEKESYENLILTTTMAFVLEQLGIAQSKQDSPLLAPTTAVTIRNAYQMQISPMSTSGWTYQLGRYIKIRFTWLPLDQNGWHVLISDSDRNGQTCYINDGRPVTSIETLKPALAEVHRLYLSEGDSPQPLLSVILALREGAIVHPTVWKCAQEQLESESPAMLSESWLATPQFAHQTSGAQCIDCINLLKLADNPTLASKAIQLWKKTQRSLGDLQPLIQELETNPTLAPHMLHALHGLLTLAWTQSTAEKTVHAWRLPKFPHQQRAYLALPCGDEVGHITLAGPTEPCTPLDVGQRFFASLESLPRPIVEQNFPMFIPIFKALGLGPIPQNDTGSAVNLMQTFVAACNRSPLQGVMRAYSLPGPRLLIDWIAQRSKLSPHLAIQSMQGQLKRELTVAEPLNQKPTIAALRALVPCVTLDKGESLTALMGRLDSTLHAILTTSTGREGLQTVSVSLENLFKSLIALVCDPSSQDTPERLRGLIQLLSLCQQRELIPSDRCANIFHTLFTTNFGRNCSATSIVEQRLGTDLESALAGDKAQRREWLTLYRLLQPHKEALDPAAWQQLVKDCHRIQNEDWRCQPLQDKLTDLSLRLKQKLNPETIQRFIDLILKDIPEDPTGLEQASIGESLVDIITKLNQRRQVPPQIPRSLFEFACEHHLVNPTQIDRLHWEFAKPLNRSEDLLPAVKKAIDYRFQKLLSPFMPDFSALKEMLMRLTERSDDPSHALVVDTLARVAWFTVDGAPDQLGELKLLNVEIVQACRDRGLPHCLLALTIIHYWLNNMREEPEQMYLTSAINFIPTVPADWKTKNSVTAPSIFLQIRDLLRNGLLKKLSSEHQRKLTSEWPGLIVTVRPSRKEALLPPPPEPTFEDHLLFWQAQTRTAMQSCPKTCEEIANRMTQRWPTIMKNQKPGRRRELNEDYVSVLVRSSQLQHLQEALVLSQGPDNANSHLMAQKILHALRRFASEDWSESLNGEVHRFLKHVCHRQKFFYAKADEDLREMLMAMPASKMHDICSILFDDASVAFLTLPESVQGSLISGVISPAMDAKKWRHAILYGRWANVHLKAEKKTYIKPITAHLRNAIHLNEALHPKATPEQVRTCLAAATEAMPLYCSLNDAEALNMLPRLYGKAFEFEGSFTSELFEFHAAMEAHHLYRDGDLRERWTTCRGLIRNICAGPLKKTGPNVIEILKVLHEITDFSDLEQVEGLMETNLRYLSPIVRATIRSRNSQGEFEVDQLTNHIVTHWEPFVLDLHANGYPIHAASLSQVVNRMTLYAPFACRALAEAFYKEFEHRPFDHDQYHDNPELLLKLVNKYQLLRDTPLFFKMKIGEQHSALCMGFMTYTEATTTAEQESCCSYDAVLALAPVSSRLILLQRQLESLSSDGKREDERPLGPEVETKQKKDRKA